MQRVSIMSPRHPCACELVLESISIRSWAGKVYHQALVWWSLVGRHWPEGIRFRQGGELVSLGPAVAEEHHDQALAFMLVPDALGIQPTTIVMPNPTPRRI